MLADMQFQSIDKDTSLVFFPRVAYGYLVEKGSSFNPCAMPTWKAALRYIAENKVQPVIELVETEDGVGWVIIGKGLNLDIKAQSKIKMKAMKFSSLTFDPTKIQRDREHLVVLNAYFGVELIRKMAEQGFEVADKTVEHINKVFVGVVAPKQIEGIPELGTFDDEITVESEQVLIPDELLTDETETPQPEGETTTPNEVTPEQTTLDF
jgi:hypothetical protein